MDVRCLYVMIRKVVLWRLILICLTHEASVFASQRTQRVWIRKMYRRKRWPCIVRAEQNTQWSLWTKCRIFRRFRKVAKSDCYLRLVRPSARPPIWDNSAHAGRIFVKFLISFLLQKICWENSGFVKIGEIRPFTLRTMFRSFDYFGYWRDHTCLCYRSFYCLCMCYGYANGPEVFINL